MVLVVVAVVVVVLTSADGVGDAPGQTQHDEDAEDSATSDSPLADYQTSGVDDARLSGGLAGVIGVVVMLLFSTGLFWLIRRREPTDSRS